MQALLAEYAWDWRVVLERLQWFILAHLADPEAILVLDETAELKKGTMSVGVARQHAGLTGQHAGLTGQIENCQTVVFCAYVTARSGTSGSGRSSATRPGSPLTSARSSAVTVISEIVSIPALGEVSSYWRGGCLTSGWQRGQPMRPGKTCRSRRRIRQRR